MKISFWEILGVVGSLSQELAEAYANDGKIDPIEMLKLGSVVVEKLGLSIDQETHKTITAIIKMASEVLKVTEDGVITTDELTQIITKVCDSLGINIVDGIKIS